MFSFYWLVTLHGMRCQRKMKGWAFKCKFGKSELWFQLGIVWFFFLGLHSSWSGLTIVIRIIILALEASRYGTMYMYWTEKRIFIHQTWWFFKFPRYSLQKRLSTVWTPWLRQEQFHVSKYWNANWESEEDHQSCIYDFYRLGHMDGSRLVDFQVRLFKWVKKIHLKNGSVQTTKLSHWKRLSWKYTDMGWVHCACTLLGSMAVLQELRSKLLIYLTQSFLCTYFCFSIIL